MKILTKALLKKLPNIGDNEKNNREHIAHVKLFGGSSWTWYITEFDPLKNLCFGLVDGFEKELGYFSLDELLELKFPPFGLPIERDRHFDSTPIKELM